MARRQSPTLTEVEQELMEVLWRLGSGSTREVLAALPESDSRAYSTIRTTLRILEEKGYLQHRQAGRSFVYYPVVEQRQSRRRAVRHLIRRFFDGSPELLVLNVLEDQGLAAEEIERLRRAIEEAPDDRPSSPPKEGPG